MAPLAEEFRPNCLLESLTREILREESGRISKRHHGFPIGGDWINAVDGQGPNLNHFQT